MMYPPGTDFKTILQMTSEDIEEEEIQPLRVTKTGSLYLDTGTFRGWLMEENRNKVVWFVLVKDDNTGDIKPEQIAFGADLVPLTKSVKNYGKIVSRI